MSALHIPLILVYHSVLRLFAAQKGKSYKPREAQGLEMTREHEVDVIENR